MIVEQTPRGRPVVEHRLRCVECGKIFVMTGSELAHSQRTTCGPKCERSLASRIFKKRSEEMHRMSAEAISKSPKIGPFESNIHARDDWSFLSPDGEVFRFRNLNHFLREHHELFLPEDLKVNRRSRTCRASVGLGDLAPWRKGKRIWKGWTWFQGESKK
jgi:hypothetical protein